MIKSFRGVLADGEQDTIRLATNNGLTGYKIHKLTIIPFEPFAAGGDQWNVVQVFNHKQTTVDAIVDFSDQALLAVAISAQTVGVPYGVTHVVFDSEVFNQDIFVTHIDKKGNSKPVNYYIELEQVKLAVDEAAVATLKDMRGS